MVEAVGGDDELALSFGFRDSGAGRDMFS